MARTWEPDTQGNEFAGHLQTAWAPFKRHWLAFLLAQLTVVAACVALEIAVVTTHWSRIPVVTIPTSAAALSCLDLGNTYLFTTLLYRAAVIGGLEVSTRTSRKGGPLDSRHQAKDDSEYRMAFRPFVKQLPIGLASVANRPNACHFCGAQTRGGAALFGVGLLETDSLN